MVLTIGPVALKPHCKFSGPHLCTIEIGIITDLNYIADDTNEDHTAGTFQSL